MLYLGILGIEKPNYYQATISEDCKILSIGDNAIGIGPSLNIGISSLELYPNISIIHKEFATFGVGPVLGYGYNNLWIKQNHGFYSGMMARLMMIVGHNPISLQVGAKEINETKFIIGISLGGGSWDRNIKS